MISDEEHAAVRACRQMRDTILPAWLAILFIAGHNRDTARARLMELLDDALDAAPPYAGVS